MTDSHCHVFASQFDGDRAEVLARAYENGVKRMIQVNNDEETQVDLLEAISAENSPVELFGTIGVHPTHFVPGSDSSEAERARLMNFWEEVLAKYPQQVVAVGETGFDFFHEHSLEAQEVYFRLHLEFAKKHHLPVVLHIRDAFPDTFRVLADYADLPMVFHCFTGTREDLQHILTSFPQAYISFSGVVTYPKSDELRAVAALVPADKFLVETDCPYLAPQEMRGKRNEPFFVTYTARIVAEIRGISYEEVERLTDANCDRLFPLSRA